MRKLKTADIPVLCRCIKRLGLKEHIQTIAKESNNAKDVWDKGFDLMWNIFDIATEQKGEGHEEAGFKDMLKNKLDTVSLGHFPGKDQIVKFSRLYGPHSLLQLLSCASVAGNLLLTTWKKMGQGGGVTIKLDHGAVGLCACAFCQPRDKGFFWAKTSPKRLVELQRANRSQLVAKTCPSPHENPAPGS